MVRTRRLSTEKDPSHLRAVDEGGRFSLNREAPAFQNVTPAGHGKRESNVLALPGLALAKGTAGRDDFIVFFRRLKWEQNLTCATLAL